MQCSNNLKQMGLAIHNYADAYNGKFPIGSPGGGKHGLFTYMLQYLELNDIFNRCDLTLPTYQGVNDVVRYEVISTYRCPSYAGPDVIRNSTMLPLCSITELPAATREWVAQLPTQTTSCHMPIAAPFLETAFFPGVSNVA